ncbi:MAG: DUF5343 domain-containing protein [Cryobacterium sp.]|nr:DUF5343 domain-containing protein [Micrococcales bacterium]MBX3079455.1 DUF5343 domain-containing protein [Cryobacterium sp.]
MAVTYPYISGQSALQRAFEQFRKAFPPVIDASLLKRFGIAPANESYLINIFRFLGLIDEDGKKVDANTDFFFQSEDAFKVGLENRLSVTYADLFAERGDGAWNEDRDTLATWFRVNDKTSDLIGTRQATTFLTLAALAGHGELPKVPLSMTKGSGASKPKTPKRKPEMLDSSRKLNSPNNSDGHKGPEFGLTVRVEVNLPAEGTAETYDAIFASIRKNLIDRD